MLNKTAFYITLFAAGAQAVKLEVCTSTYADLLAQMRVYTDYASCTVTADRVKVGAENLEEMSNFKNSEAEKQGKAWTDPAFPRDLNAIYWKGLDVIDDPDDLLSEDELKQIKFLRLSEHE